MCVVVPHIHSPSGKVIQYWRARAERGEYRVCMCICVYVCVMKRGSLHHLVIHAHQREEGEEFLSSTHTYQGGREEETHPQSRHIPRTVIYAAIRTYNPSCAVSIISPMREKEREREGDVRALWNAAKKGIMEEHKALPEHSMDSFHVPEDRFAKISWVESVNVRGRPRTSTAN